MCCQGVCKFTVMWCITFLFSTNTCAVIHAFLCLPKLISCSLQYQNHFFSRCAAPEAPVGGCTPKSFFTPYGHPENHTLACLLHCQLNAPLKISKSLILLGLFISSQYFFFVTTRRTSSGSLRSMHLPHGIVCSLCTCLLKYPELWKVQVHTMRQGH